MTSTTNMISELKAESKFKVGDAVVYVTKSPRSFDESRIADAATAPWPVAPKGVVVGVSRRRGRFTYAVMIPVWSCELNGLKADWLKPSK